MPYVDNKGIRIHYEVEGRGPPFVLIHGLCHSLRDWYDNGYVESLKSGYRLILVDVRGHGFSDKPHDSKEYTMELLVSDLVAVLDALKISKAHFLGYSRGGRIGFGIAKHAAERIYSLVIGGSHPYKKTSADERAVIDSLVQLWKKGAEAVIADYEKETGSKMAPNMRAMLMSNDPKAIIAFMSAEDFALSLEDVLPTMKMPCLIYVGEADCGPQRNYANARRCVENIPNATFVSLPGLNHREAERIDVMLPHITKFLEGVKHTRSNRP